MPLGTNFFRALFPQGGGRRGAARLGPPEEQQRVRPICPLCRIKLVDGEPVRCLAAEHAIAAKKQAIIAAEQATIAEVQQAEKETVMAEVAAEAAADGAEGGGPKRRKTKKRSKKKKAGDDT